MNFWQNIKKPILALAPMAGFTDPVFCSLCGRFGADVVYSEMISATALAFGSDKTLDMVRGYKGNSFYVVQLFGSDPDHFGKAAEIVSRKISPDGIDINLGCPAPKVIKSEGGAKLMQDPKKVREVVASVTDATKLPVSLKLRIRSGEVSADNVINEISDLPLGAVMIHGRSLAGGFTGKVDHEAIKELACKYDFPVIANGGVHSHEDADRLLVGTKAAGLGVARGALGRPWIFKEIKDGSGKEMTREEAFDIALEHSRAAHKAKKERGIIELRKHLPWYVRDMEGAKKIRNELIKVADIKDVEEVFARYR